jgi:hypothetical protein
MRIAPERGVDGGEVDVQEGHVHARLARDPAPRTPGLRQLAVGCCVAEWGQYRIRKWVPKRATSGPSEVPKCCIGRMSERETVVELPLAADSCPCVEKLRTVLPLTVGIRDGVLQFLVCEGAVPQGAQLRAAGRRGAWWHLCAPRAAWKALPI